MGGVKFFWGGLRGGQNFFDGPKGRLIFYGSKGANFFFQEGGLLFGGGGCNSFWGGPKGGAIFCVGQRGGGQNFFPHLKGGRTN